MTTALATHHVRAFNAATESENRIHDDAVARAHGYRGGLVPGVAVYAYMTAIPARTWGRAWVEHGTMQARFVKPAYDGEDVTVHGELTRESGAESVSLSACGPDGEVRAIGVATLPVSTPAPPSLDDYPEVPLPTTRPTADVGSLAPGTVLGSVESGFDAALAPEFLDEIGDDLALYQEDQIAHPGWLIQAANVILVANVSLGPWVHTESRATHFGCAHDGERISTRARVAERFERKGHQLVVLHVLQIADDKRALQHVTHTAIYELAPR